VSVVVDPATLLEQLKETDSGDVLAPEVGAVHADLPVAVALTDLGLAQALSGCVGDHKGCVDEREDVRSVNVLTDPAQGLLDPA
jgi:hypothetical protein